MCGLHSHTGERCTPGQQVPTDFPVSSIEMAIIWTHREPWAQGQLRPRPHFAGLQNLREPGEGLPGTTFLEPSMGKHLTADTLLPPGRGNAFPASTCS